MCFARTPMVHPHVPSAQVLQFGIMIHSLVIGLTLAIASGADFTSLVAAISFHQLFEGLSLGIRIAALPAPRDGPSHLVWLKPVLAILFAITTPVGITIGLLSFGAAGSGGVRLKVIEGLMSAISAGMLIYAACVEMLAGDFVLDPTLWRSGFRRQLLALVSLVAGATAMALLGLVS
ncbi:Zinc/iron permease [Artomyces pyxidatus]|uniref:Zinc/iron permease n=1 Tax=Artomyces pyxidatus TaxID=48021 RepID=A0ACB8T8P0_9AGAM|nr:Zinc/iron permease [Artomyces pyxidatus]